MVSYWLQGPAAAFASWAQLVARYLEGVAQFEATGDETGLKTVVNVDLGLPYAPRSRGASAALSEAGLRDGASDRAWRVAPMGTRFLTAAVDVQIGRFVVQVEAWGEGLERTVVDRFDIHAPPPESPRAADRQIDPARYGEDWEALFALADKSYPVAGSDHGLRAVSVIIDSGGAPGVTPNAYAFYRRARRSHPRRFHLVRGKGGERAKRAEVSTPETAHKGKKHVARDVRIIWAGTDRLKDEVAASLLRDQDGARALHIPKGAPPEIFAEYAAERRSEKGWEKKPGIKRNEALDLSVYSLALAIVLGAESVNEDNPPAWARVGPDNAYAVLAAAEGAGEAPAKPVAEAARSFRASRWRRGPGRRFDGWG
jgi:phage terminase large subunit GpA-like protein